MLNPRHQRSIAGDVDLDAFEVHERDLPRDLANRGHERVDATGLPTRRAVHEIRSEQARDPIDIPPRDGIRHREGCLHDALDVSHPSHLFFTPTAQIHPCARSTSTPTSEKPAATSASRCSATVR